MHRVIDPKATPHSDGRGESFHRRNRGHPELTMYRRIPGPSPAWPIPIIRLIRHFRRSVISILVSETWWISGVSGEYEGDL